MNSENTKLFLQWFENRATTYDSLFSLTGPERRYWINELYTRFKAYCDRPVGMGITINPVQHTATLALATRGNRHILAGDTKTQKPVGAEPGWHILAWNLALPPGLHKEDARQSTRDDLKILDIKPLYTEVKIAKWEVEMYTDNDESRREHMCESTIVMMIQLVGPHVGPHNTDLNFNAIAGLSLIAQKGLVGILAFPRPVEKDRIGFKQIEGTRRY